MQLNWFTKLCLRFAPWTLMRRAAKDQGVKPDYVDHAIKLLGKAERVDFFPLDSRNGRGFVIVLDKKFSLHFYQDGDHFIYDGFEMGEYNEGDVTVFDNLGDKIKSMYP